jgi:hypothetical protein
MWGEPRRAGGGIYFVGDDLVWQSNRMVRYDDVGDVGRRMGMGEEDGLIVDEMIMELWSLSSGFSGGTFKESNGGWQQWA